MGTPYSDIIALALISIQDYKLDALRRVSEEEWLQYLTVFMIRGLPNFDNVTKDLSKRDDELMMFDEDLTMLEQDIIADYTVITWIDKELNDVKQMTGMLQNGSQANRHSEGNLLKEKMNLRSATTENVDRKKISYGLKGVNWDSWGK